MNSVKVINVDNFTLRFTMYTTCSCSLRIIQGITLTRGSGYLRGNHIVDEMTKKQKKQMYEAFKKTIGQKRVVITQQNGNAIKTYSKVFSMLKFKRSAKFSKVKGGKLGYGVGYFYKWQSIDNF